MADGDDSIVAPARRHPADRHYSPVEAAYAAAQYLNFDPSFFLNEIALAGMVLTTNGKMIHHFDSDELELSADLSTFLWCWMKVSKGGKALRELMIQRGLVEI